MQQLSIQDKSTKRMHRLLAQEGDRVQDFAWSKLSRFAFRVPCIAAVKFVSLLHLLYTKINSCYAAQIKKYKFLTQQGREEDINFQLVVTPAIENRAS